MSGEKTEQPTNKKLRDAREKGQVPRSKELSTTAVLIFSFASMLFMGGTVYDVLAHYSVTSLKIEEVYNLRGTEIFNFAFEFFKGLLLALVPFFLAALVMAVISNIALGGFIFAFKNARPQFNRINPINGIKNLFSVKQLIELIKSILKAVIIMVPAYFMITDIFHTYMGNRLLLDITVFAPDMAADLFSYGLFFSCFLIALVMIDVPFQSYNHIKQLKMSKQEIKDEYKNSEGNPEIKGRRRRVQYEMAAKAKGSRVQNADIVIVNPVHYSVGIKFDPNTMDTPIVVALGADQYALVMREKAKEMKIPVIPIPPLARVLYKTCRVGSEIPVSLYEPMVTVLAAIYQLDDRLAFKVTEKFIERLAIDESKF